MGSTCACINFCCYCTNVLSVQMHSCLHSSWSFLTVHFLASRLEHLMTHTKRSVLTNVVLKHTHSPWILAGWLATLCTKELYDNPGSVWMNSVPGTPAFNHVHTLPICSQVPTVLPNLCFMRIATWCNWPYLVAVWQVGFIWTTLAHNNLWGTL